MSVNKKIFKRQSASMLNLGDHANFHSSNKEKFRDIFSFRTKSMDANLDKIGEKEKNKKHRNNKQTNKPLPHRGHTFCISPEQIGFRFKAKGKTVQDTDMNFMGINLRRPSPKGKLIALNSLLLSLTPDQRSCAENTHKLIGTYLGQLRVNVCGDTKREKVLNEKEYTVLTETMIKSGFITTLVTKVPLMGFEERKVACLIFCNLFKRNASEGPTVSYIESHPKLLFSLLDGYRNQALALISGRMLRECVRYEPLASAILNSDNFYDIFDFLQISTFEVSSDAFITLQDLLFENKKLTAEYMKSNYKKFFSHFDNILTCDNYVTQVTSLKLLGSMLLDRRFYDVMRQYVEDASNLKRIILLMSSSLGNIQLEGFHIFKIFLANPDPTRQVRSIFVRNKERLIRLLQMIEGEKYGEQFDEEKTFLIKQLRDVEKGSGNTTSVSTSDTETTGDHLSD